MNQVSKLIKLPSKCIALYFLQHFGEILLEFVLLQLLQQQHQRQKSLLM